MNLSVNYSLSRTITSSFYRSSDGVILTYSITDQKSFENIRGWMEDINTYATAHICLVATKLDLANERVVSKEQGTELANEFSTLFAHRFYVPSFSIVYLVLPLPSQPYVCSVIILLTLHTLQKYHFSRHQPKQGTMWRRCSLIWFGV